MNKGIRNAVTVALTSLGLAVVTLPASAQNQLSVLPDLPFQASGFAGGTFTPTPAAYTLSNAGPDTLTWAIARAVPWISVSEAQGVLGEGETVAVEIFPNSQAVELAAGSYGSSLTWIDQTHGELVETRVTLEVNLPGPATLEVLDVALRDAFELTFSGEPGTPYLIEATGDFLIWSLVLSNVFESETAVFREEMSEASKRFFRVVSLAEDAVPTQLSLANVTVEDPQRLRLTGDAGGNYLVELSTNQLDWMPWRTNFLPDDGSLLLTNSLAVDGLTYYYRATGLDSFTAPVAHHVLLTGQSLAVGASGNPALSTAPGDMHWRFFSDGQNDVISRLSETSVETIMTAAARQVSLVASNHELVVTLVGRGSADYSQLKKGTDLYERGVQQFRRAAAPVSRRMRDYLPSAIFVLHGEADHLDPDYDLSVREWQEDYETDVRNVTGQDVPLPMFHTQISSWTRFGAENAVATTVANYELLAESLIHPSQTILVGPKYVFPYADGVHLTNTSYRWLGEYYGKVYRKVVVEGQSWSPLRPIFVGRTNNVITVRFHVPEPPLVLDTNLVSNPGHFGFEYWNDSGSPPPILAVRLRGEDTVEMAIAGLPFGVEERLRYAYTGIPGQEGGPMTGPRGNLRDSDAEPSIYGNTLYNWCVHFDEPIVTGP